MSRDRTAIVYEGPELVPGIEYMVMYEMVLYAPDGDTDPLEANSWWVTGVVPPTPFYVE